MRLKKYRGQHLLTDTNMLNKIVDSAMIQPGDNLIEIGAGTGLLTGQLVQKAGRVISFEIDRDMEAKLRAMEANHRNLTLMMGDFLQWDMAGFLRESGQKWRVTANIPYNITSPILEKLIEEGTGHLLDAYLLMQKEVAMRIISPPGCKEYGRLSVFVNYYADSSILFNVPPSVFLPPPKVDSSLLKLVFDWERHQKQDEAFNKSFFKLVSLAFSQRRKQLGKILRREIPGLTQEKTEECFHRVGIDPRSRGESLSQDDFIKLTRALKDLSSL